MDTAIIEKPADGAMHVSDTAPRPIPVLDAAAAAAAEAPSAMAPVRKAFAVACVVAAMNLAFFPRAVLDRLNELEPGPAVDAAVSSVEAVVKAVDGTGLPGVFAGLREGFLDRVAH